LIIISLIVAAIQTADQCVPRDRPEDTDETPAAAAAPLRIEARIDRCNQRKAADQEAACNQEHHCQRYFRDRQETSHMLAATLASTLAALFEVRLQVGRGCEERGCQSKRQRSS
jgi:hypothetical protein